MDANYLKVPQDYESLPAFRILCAELRQRCVAQFGSKTIEALATFLFMRLWVELRLLARTTNRPGYLTQEGKRLFASTVDELFGENCDPIQLLEASGLLKRDGQEGHICELFAPSNQDAAGNYVKREVKGAHASALVRRGGQLVKDAVAQALLLPPEIFRKADGTKMTDGEVNASMVLIKTLDSCLRSAGRPKGQYTEGLMASAAAVVEKHRPEDLRPFYEWLMAHHADPGVPKTAEGILSQWNIYFEIALANH